MAAENTVVSCHSVDLWKEQFQIGKDSKKLVKVDFWASWCGQCKVMAPVLAELAKMKPEVMFLKVDVDELKSLAEEMHITAIPTFIFFKDGEIIDKLIGANKPELTKKVEQLSAI